MSDIRSLIRNADPHSRVNDPAQEVVDAILDQIRAGTVEATVAAGPSANRGRRGSIWAGAALAVTLVVLGAGVLLGRGTSQWAASPSVSIAEAYLDARNNYDADAAAALVADNAQLRDTPAMASPSELALAFRYLEMIGERYTSFACSASGPATVTCDYNMDSRLRREADRPAVPGRVEFTIEDGRIISIANAIDLDPFEIITVEWLNYLGGDAGFKKYYRLLADGDGNLIASARLDVTLLDSLQAALERYLAQR